MPNTAQNQRNRDIFADNLIRLMAQQGISDKELCDQINRRFRRKMAPGTMKLYKEKKQLPNPKNRKYIGVTLGKNAEYMLIDHRPQIQPKPKAKKKGIIPPKMTAKKNRVPLCEKPTELAVLIAQQTVELTPDSLTKELRLALIEEVLNAPVSRLALAAEVLELPGEKRDRIVWLLHEMEKY